ncbi:coiled-coil domain-containing protein 167 [Huso huso]|uniref:Coiled-coil domain-containing protein 167 n=1 Tax=Huso huso TaxID=61971 RepID=A0ABR0ZXN5_HUSHU
MRKTKKQNISIAKEIDSVEGRLSLCRDSLEGVEFRLRKEELSDEGRQSLEEEKTILMHRVSKYEGELQSLRGENRRNMLLSVTLLALFVLLYTSWTS